MPLFRVLSVICCLFSISEGGLWAHDPGISTAQGELQGGILTVTTGFAPADIELLLPPGLPRAERWAEGEFESVRQSLLAIAPRLWELEMGGGGRLEPRDPSVELLPGDNVSFRVRFLLRSEDRVFGLRAALISRLPPGHRQFVVISDAQGSTLVKKLLNSKDFALEWNVRERQVGNLGVQPDQAAIRPVGSEGGTTFAGFLRLGMEHIWTGYDHLLFLLGLLVVCRTFRSTLTIVTCFTLAHSLTLGLAAFNLVSISSRWVEAAIAVSIVFVGAENLLRGGTEPKGRWAVTFGFGLIHGFGFASVLRDLGVGAGKEGVAIPLLAFNLGVEIGQIAVAGLALPLLWRLSRNKRYSEVGIPVVSGAVALAGLVWLCQRTLLQ